MPEVLQKEVSQWGYPKDEYTDNGNWSPQLYIREARRMVGEYVMTQTNYVGEEVVEDPIGLAAYTMDSHSCQRIVVEGQLKNEGNVEISCPTEGASIAYQLRNAEGNGLYPTWQVYTEPLELAEGQTLIAMGERIGYTPSEKITVQP